MDPRARERELRQRGDEAIVIAIRRHAEDQRRGRAGEAGGGGRALALDRSLSPRGGAGTPHGTKRKGDTTFGPETVEQWASTEVRLSPLLTYDLCTSHVYISEL